MKHIKAIIILILLFPCFVLSAQNAETQKRLEQKADEALTFCKKNKYNTDFCILIDMKVHSGKNRMFVWSFKTNSIEKEALCAHGAGNGDKRSTGATPIFSNDDGSRCTSLGKYRVGGSYPSKWGINIGYQLHGLDSTNSNAYRRAVTLHSYTPLPNSEIYPQHLPMGWSWGCTVTSDDMMTYLNNKLKTNKKSTFMWIYF